MLWYAWLSWQSSWTLIIQLCPPQSPVLEILCACFTVGLLVKCQSITCLPLSPYCRKESGTDPTWTCQLVLPGFSSGASCHVIPNMGSQTVRVVTLSVPTEGNPCSHCCSTTQQFHKSSSTMPEMHYMPRTKLQSTAVCVAFWGIALHAWLLNQDASSLPPPLFSSALVQPSIQWLSRFSCSRSICAMVSMISLRIL